MISSQNKPTGHCWSEPKAIIKGQTHHTQSRRIPQRKRGRGQGEGVEKAFTDPPTPSLQEDTQVGVPECGEDRAPCTHLCLWSLLDQGRPIEPGSKPQLSSCCHILKP